ncbi:MAG: M10 family metallopeptidase C-terminal domain-containing protein [Arenibacterium sp.]
MSDEILSALQFAFLNNKDPINTTGSAAYEITYDFATTAAPSDLPTSTVLTGWTPFTAAEKVMLRTQMDHIETFLNVTFVEAPGAADPDLNLGKVTIPGITAGLGGTSISAIGTMVSRWDGFAVFDNTIDLTAPNEANLILHELGHALGAKHPFDDGTVLPSETENNKYTVMSYTENPDSNAFSNTMMLYDHLVLQDIWGAAEHKTGNTTYTGSSNGALEVIWDTDGDDRLSANGRSNDVTLDLRDGKFSSFDSVDDIAIAFGVTIERAVGGAGNDQLTGNSAANTLSGKGGADTLSGGKGGDNLKGGSGADVLIGGKGKDTLNGGKGDDSLTGNGAADRFIYKGKAGADTISGFQDDSDTLVIRKQGDLNAVLAAADQVGSDVVFDFGAGNSLTVLNASLNAISDDILA